MISLVCHALISNQMIHEGDKELIFSATLHTVQTTNVLMYYIQNHCYILIMCGCGLSQ